MIWDLGIPFRVWVYRDGVGHLMHVLDEVEEVDLLARVCLEQPCLRILLSAFGFRANLEHIRQSRPDSGHGFQAKVLKTF